MKNTTNLLPAYMGAAEQTRMGDLLEPVDLPVRMKLARPRSKLEHVYFVDEGMASVVARANGDDQIEVAVVGNEGAACSGIFIGAVLSTQDISMQTAGSGRRITAANMATVMQGKPKALSIAIPSSESP